MTNGEIQPPQPQPVEAKKPEPPKAGQPKGPGVFEKIKLRLATYRRVLEVARKPDKEEFMSSAKITAVGIGLIGAVGFVIYLVYILLTAVA